MIRFLTATLACALTACLLPSCYEIPNHAVQYHFRRHVASQDPDAFRRMHAGQPDVVNDYQKYFPAPAPAAHDEGGYDEYEE